ncbi:hypothetical protein [Helicobacter pylori]|nr:hypothetical protein [Helicobacter pylori]
MMFSLFGKNKSHKPLEGYFKGCKTPCQTKQQRYKTESISTKQD